MSPAEVWSSLLREDVELTEGYWLELARRMSGAHLRFGDRLSCPFLRPLFMSVEDEARQRRSCEVLAAIGERMARDAPHDRLLLDAFGLSEDERRLVAIDPGYEWASTASRVDSFLLPDSLKFAEYNAESPAGLGYTERLAGVFDALPVMDRFRAYFDVWTYPLMDTMLEALLASYRDWGGTANPPRMVITDFREVPTWSEFEILADHFTEHGVPTVICDPRDLEISGERLIAHGAPVDLVYRRLLVNDIINRPNDVRVLVDAYTRRLACVANTFRCKIPHRKTFFAVLTDERHGSLFSSAEHAVIAAHVPWTRVVEDRHTTAPDGATVDLLSLVRKSQQALVLKPADDYGGHGVTLGWEVDATTWDTTLQAAVSAAPGSWIVQQRIPVSRERFPVVERDPHRVVQRDMLVDCAPYLFRGKVSGFLTRLSATGLANVTSGGGQVPVFRVAPVRAQYGIPATG